MKKRIFTLFIFCLLGASFLTAQINRCGHFYYHQNKAAANTSYQEIINQTFEYAKRQAQLDANSRSKQVLTVPVVVHVVHNTPTQNVSDELIHSQIKVLNEDFQRMNADAVAAREMYRVLGGNAEIQFVLADIDPNGNPTTGITRTETAIPTFMDISIEAALTAIDSCEVDIFGTPSDEELDCLFGALFSGQEEGSEGVQLDDVKFTAKGGQDAWNTQQYINIWVCNLNANFMGEETPMIMGFGYPPIEAPNWPQQGSPENLAAIDGIVIHHEAFGVNNPNAGLIQGIFSKGRTCTHEMGHYFGLRHISGDGNCQEDDGITDTPPEVASQNLELNPNPVCEELKNLDTCPEDDLPDMYENFMSYNPEPCQNLFTIEQVGIMRAMLEGPRAGLIIEQLTNTYSTALNQALSLYPNPAAQHLKLHLDGFDLADFTIEIQTITGQPLGQLPATTSIDISHLNTGVYLLRLKNEKLETVRKLAVIN